MKILSDEAQSMLSGVAKNINLLEGQMIGQSCY